MKLQFDPNQQYQLDAINSVVELFTGQPLSESSFESDIQLSSGQADLFELVTSNKLVIDEEQIAKNTHQVQQKSGLEKSGLIIERHIPASEQSQDYLKDGLNFSLEMETGTGKTYVYLRSIFELHKTYGFKKFIVVVPSIAIKEGVLKNLEITAEHFATLYDRPKVDFYVYDSKDRVQTKNFAKANSLQIMVMNIQSFVREAEDYNDKKSNILYRNSDWGIPIEYIKATNPIVIVDEPQSMETEKARKAISNLNPLCTLRYSATHRNSYNLIYKLTPVDAYDLGLVKRIEVDSVIQEESFNQSYLELKDVSSRGNNVSAKLGIDVQTGSGVEKKVVTVKVDSDLFELSGEREAYRNNFVVEEIDPVSEFVKFTNGQIIYAGQVAGGYTDDIVKTQIRQTIINHLEKELRLLPLGIKVLSLFFIDRVDNYRQYLSDSVSKGKYAIWFEEIFKEITQNPKYAPLQASNLSVDSLHDGYFSRDKNGHFKDTNGSTKADDDTYELIMKDKERLLSLDTPLKFIFSHSALREGWDSPNVFQICTLNETSSEIKKRQEIGRGLRLPVNQQGERVADKNIAVLTVVANEHYDDFARGLQTEIEQECGVDFSGRIADAKKKKQIRLKKGYQLDPEFQALWDKIKFRTRYNVAYDTDELIRRATKELQSIEVTSPRIRVVSVDIVMDDKGVTSAPRRIGEKRVAANEIMVPDVLSYLQTRTRLTKQTLLAILNQAQVTDKLLKNPQQFLDQASNRLLTVLHELMVEGIKYERVTDSAWEMTRFENEELWGYLNNIVEVQNQEKTLYDFTLTDSDTESKFAKELERNEDVKFYFKLPRWFKIETPLGSYSPDWAFVLENETKIYFVAETKGDVNQELRPSEKMKIECGKKHFEQLPGVEFRGPISTLLDI